MLPYLIKRAAQRDFDEAFDWYEKVDPSRGDDFVAHYRVALDFIREKPEAQQTIYRDIRAKSLTVYPYRLMYRVRQGKVVIIAVHHNRRNPQVWQRRA